MLILFRFKLTDNNQECYPILKKETFVCQYYKTQVLQIEIAMQIYTNEFFLMTDYV